MDAKTLLFMEEIIELKNKLADIAARRMYEYGFEDGVDEGLNLAYAEFSTRWVELYASGKMRWLGRPETWQEMEERRYGPLPEGWADPPDEEHPGEARRRARARQGSGSTTSSSSERVRTESAALESEHPSYVGG